MAIVFQNVQSKAIFIIMESTNEPTMSTTVLTYIDRKRNIQAMKYPEFPEDYYRKREMINIGTLKM